MRHVAARAAGQRILRPIRGGRSAAYAGAGVAARARPSAGGPGADHCDAAGAVVTRADYSILRRSALPTRTARIAAAVGRFAGLVLALLRESISPNRGPQREHIARGPVPSSRTTPPLSPTSWCRRSRPRQLHFLAMALIFAAVPRWLCASVGRCLSTAASMTRHKCTERRHLPRSPRHSFAEAPLIFRKA
jgi:hypothetical protein